MIRVAINGFGRIGRLCMRAALERGDIQVVAINDLSPTERRAHLLQYDSVHGRLPFPVQATKDSLVLKGESIACFQEKDPTKLPWEALKVDVVLECTGIFRGKSKAALHQQAGAKRVIISAPGKSEDPPDATFVMGVNHLTYQKDLHHIVSNASCTTNCLAPVIKVLHENFSVAAAMMTTIHSYTNDQSITDNDHSDLRRARAAALSMIPTSTGASEAIAQVYPILQGLVEGTSIRVPTADVSLIDLSVQLKKEVTEASVNQAFTNAANTSPLQGILAVSNIPLVSVDYIHEPYSAIVDLPLTQVLQKNWVKVIAWYDNEWGFSNRMLDLACFISA